jgi:hypothetical protein
MALWMRDFGWPAEFRSLRSKASAMGAPRAARGSEIRQAAVGAWRTPGMCEAWSREGLGGQLMLRGGPRVGLDELEIWAGVLMVL